MAVDFSGLRNQTITLAAAKLNRAADKMTNDLKRNAPVDTGELRRNTGVMVRSSSPPVLKAIAEIDVDYGIYVVSGTSAHVIKAKNARALRFNWPKAGGVVFFTSVNHPGTTANPFFTDVVRRFGDYLQSR